MGLLKQKRDLFLVYFAPTNKTISLMIVKNLLIHANYRKVVKNRLKLKGFISKIPSIVTNPITLSLYNDVQK